MKIVHHLGGTMNEGKQATLGHLGVRVRCGIAAFEISECDPRFAEIDQLRMKWNLIDVVRTEFTDEEKLEAQYLKLQPDWHHDYPQPAGDFGYRSVTYDLYDACSKCGIGERQKAPFRITREPRWGKRQILQLNWVFDEYFVRPEAWEAVFRPFGIACLPVLRHSNGSELKTVVQLQIPERIDLVIGPGAHPLRQCEGCGREKFLPIVRGFLPPMERESQAAACKSTQWFGSGGSAWNMAIVDQDLYRRAREFGLKGVGFAPLAPRADSSERTLER